MLNRQIKIGQSISHLKKIYLDTNYWIRITDCKTPEDKALLSVLEKLVKEDKIIVPTSEITFWEILKQTDMNSLRKSAQLIDRLSKGISIVNEKERQKLEFIDFVRRHTSNQFYDINTVVWTKLSLNLLNPFFVKQNPEMLNERFVDFLENLTFEKIISFLESTSNLKPFYFKDNIEALNYAKEQYSTQNKNFNEMYLSELGGYLEVFENDFNQYYEEMYFSETGKIVSEEEKKNIDSKGWCNMIYNFSKYNKFKNELPSYRIFPLMNAEIRWNKTRKYKDGNDTIDFLHVTASLPYFDFFFTERELRSIINKHKLNDIYNCHVLSNINDVLGILQKNFT
ncbi:hypothetical protein [Flavobacterium soli]|uniref:hypothetical protein n=1 Tax=Flavobacterium soli TaxID=344881 RepID=UPI00041C9ED8|nr:hypothetical protein [Flavobacterium soli]